MVTNDAAPGTETSQAHVLTDIGLALGMLAGLGGLVTAYIFESPYGAGAGGIVFFEFFFRLLTGTWNPLQAAIGRDKFPSISRFQFLLWTVVIIFAYIAIYTARLSKGYTDNIPGIPENLLILMGMSSGAMLGSNKIDAVKDRKGMSSGTNPNLKKTDAGETRKPARSPADLANGLFHPIKDYRFLICDDTGKPDLNKLQMAAWTFIAIFIYLCSVGTSIGAGELDSLPNLDTSLLLLMGISQGTYLVTKGISNPSKPVLKALNKARFEAGDRVELNGSGFGDDISQLISVTIDNGRSKEDPERQEWFYYPNDLRGLSLENNRVAFRMPELDPGRYTVGLQIGSESSDSRPFEITEK